MEAIKPDEISAILRQQLSNFNASAELEEVGTVLQVGNTLTFGVEEKGQGKIIYFVDNPLFRCFWEQGKFVFGNAVFIVR